MPEDARRRVPTKCDRALRRCRASEKRLDKRSIPCFIFHRMSMDDTNSLIEQRKAKLAALEREGH